MFNNERIEKIINNAPFSFPPNCYLFENLDSGRGENQLEEWHQYIVLGPSVNEKMDKSGISYKIKYYYENHLNRVTHKEHYTNYYEKGNVGNFGFYDIYNDYIKKKNLKDSKEKIKKLFYILKNSIDEDYIFTLPYVKNETKLFYKKIGIKKIS